MAGPDREHKANHRAGERENKAFGEDLPRERPGTGPYSDADAELVSASGGAREHQVGEIHAGEQQDEADDGGENVERANEFEAQAGGKTFSGGSDFQPHGEEAVAARAGRRGGSGGTKDTGPN